MRFFVVNRHNGKKYPAEGQHWPEHGWSVDIFDFSPGTWGSAQSGVGDGPVIAKGWQHDLERQGWDFPPLTQPVNVRDTVMKKLAGSLQPKPEPPPPASESKIDWSKRLAALRRRRGEVQESKAKSIVSTLLEDRTQLSVGTKLEKEHFRNGKPKDKTPAEVAGTHLGENPDYYPLTPKPKGAKEALRWVKSNKPVARPKASFYPSSGGPSSI